MVRRTAANDPDGRGPGTKRTVVLTVGAREYKVVSSATEDELTRLADTVNAKLAEVTPPGRPEPPQALLLTALALAHDLEEERLRTRSLERKSRDMMRRVLLRLDGVLDLEGSPGAS
jgi:cell division protein ZapA